MCYAPIRIKNNRKFYRPMLDQMYLTVPCGKCAECIASARDDWFVRLYYEWQKYLSPDVNGCSLFVTFTMNDDNIPYLDFSDEKFSVIDDWFYFLSRSPYYTATLSSEVEHFESFWKEKYVFNTNSLEFGFDTDKGFCKRDLQLMLKSLRQYLDRLYKDKNIYGLGLKYYIVCERGSSDNHRPHYHVIFFVPYQVDPIKFLELCRVSWSKLVPLSEVPEEYKKLSSQVPKGSYKIFDVSNSGWNNLTIKKAPNGSCRFFITKGFVNYSKDKDTHELLPFVKTQGNLKYITKYFHKLDEYSKSDNYKRFYDWYKVLRSSYFNYKSLMKDNLNVPHYAGFEKLHKVLLSIADYFPFTLASTGIGQGLLTQLYNMDYTTRKKFLLLDKPVEIKGSTKSYRIPSYILSRLFYNYADFPQFDNPVRLVTPLAMDCIKLRLVERVKKFANGILFTDNILRKNLDFNDLDDFKKEFNISVSDYYSYYTGVMTRFGSSLTMLGLYSIVFKDVVCNKELKSVLEDFTYDDFIQLAKDMFNTRVDSSNELVINTVNYGNYLFGNTFNSLPLFEGYDKILECHSWIKNRISTKDNAYKLINSQDLDEDREALLQLLYNF